MTNYTSYSSEFSETSFWSKIKSMVGNASREVITKAFELFYAYKDGNLSMTQKASVLGALGYLILPIDAIPDYLPIVGFTDDLAALKWAYDTVSGAITAEIKKKAANESKKFLA